MTGDFSTTDATKCEFCRRSRAQILPERPSFGLNPRQGWVDWTDEAGLDGQGSATAPPILAAFGGDIASWGRGDAGLTGDREPDLSLRSQRRRKCAAGAAPCFTPPSPGGTKYWKRH